MFKKSVVALALLAGSVASYGGAPNLNADQMMACKAILCLVPPGPSKSECRDALKEYFLQGVRNVFKPSFSSIKRARKGFLKMCPNENPDAETQVNDLVNNNMHDVNPSLGTGVDSIQNSRNEPGNPCTQYLSSSDNYSTSGEAYGRCYYAWEQQGKPVN